MKPDELRREIRELENQGFAYGMYKPIEKFDSAVARDRKVFKDIYPFYSTIAMEEGAEFTQAVSKAFRDWMDNPINDSISNEDVKLNLCEEIADVLMMIERIRSLYGLDSNEINKILNIKYERYAALVAQHEGKKEEKKERKMIIS